MSEKKENIEVRTALEGDRAGIRALWRERFHDSEAFMDWLFTERYYPGYSACLLEDGAVVCAMQGCPLHVFVRGRVLPALMLAGVSTHPSREGRGYMRRVFVHFMQIARGARMPIVFHTPVHFETFHARGHFPASDTLWLNAQAANAAHMPPEVCAWPMDGRLSALHARYQAEARRYSGCVSRTVADFTLKFRDYAADGGQCLVAMKPGTEVVDGYCVYYPMDSALHAEECMAKDDATLQALVDALAYTSAGRALTVKLPPDAQICFPGASLEGRPQGAMGAADAPALLKALLDKPEYTFEIIDKTVPENEGIFDGAGNSSTRAPQIRLEAGRLMQYLCGYRSLCEMSADIEILDPSAAQALDGLLPKLTCFVVDEY